MSINVEIDGWKKVYKAELPPFFLERIKRELTFPNPVYEGMEKHRPFVLKALLRKGEAPLPFVLFYRQTPEYILVPRAYKLGFDHVVTAGVSTRVPAEFPQPLKPLWGIQQEAIEAWRNQRAAEGVFVMPTGSGKTILGLEIARRLKQKTLILTNRDKTGLLNWQRDCVKYLGFKPGVIQGSKCNIDSPVTIGMFQTLNARRDLLEELRDTYGMVLVDECLTLDTIVSTPHGEAVLNDLHVGHKVWSFNFKTQEIEEDSVLAESTKEDDVYEVSIKVNGRINRIRCSGNHPFYHPDGTKTEACKLQIGASILTT